MNECIATLESLQRECIFILSFFFFFFSALLPDYTLLSFFFTSCHCIYLLYSLIQANDVGILVVVMSILYFHENLWVSLGPNLWGTILVRVDIPEIHKNEMSQWMKNQFNFFSLFWRYSSKCNEKLFEVASRLPLQWGSMAQSDNF